MRSMIFVLAIFVAAVPCTDSRAAESYDNCTGFIDSIPTTISTQGVWCLRRDLAGNISSGASITIAGNNVTIDCNGYKLGNLAAGIGTLASGIRSERINSVVRNCNVRGYAIGIDLSGESALIERNRLDSNTSIGIRAVGEGSVVQYNLVYDTGNATIHRFATGIQSDNEVDVLDNKVAGVFLSLPIGATGGVHGVQIGAKGRGLVARNRITRVRYSFQGGGSIAYGGIRSYATSGSYLRINDNALLDSSNSLLVCIVNSDTRARGNFGSPIVGCVDDGNTP